LANLAAISAMANQLSVNSFQLTVKDNTKRLKAIVLSQRRKAGSLLQRLLQNSYQPTVFS